MRPVGGLVMMVALLAGCAAAEGATSAATGTASPSPSMVACAIVEGQELPDYCIPYDPDDLFAANERYKSRYPLDPESFAAFEAIREPVSADLVALRGTDGFTPERVKEVLVDAGLDSTGIYDEVHAWERDGTIEFWGVGPAGGCVEGMLSAAEFEIEIKGYILDGGCVALEGH